MKLVPFFVVLFFKLGYSLESQLGLCMIPGPTFHVSAKIRLGSYLSTVGLKKY
jgi:hypothetical protein